jgi:predicted RNA-binding Zn ribbon-like protein
MNVAHHAESGAALGADLVNTYGWVSGTEFLNDDTTVRTLADNHGVAPGDDVGEGDISRIRAVRPVLREAFTSDDEEAVVATLNGLLAETRPVPMLTRNDEGEWTMEHPVPDGSTADRLIAAAAVGLLLEIGEHGLRRLSVCAADDCLDVMVDTSRNHSKRYCIPDVCGNRATTRAYRARKAAASDE